MDTALSLLPAGPPVVERRERRGQPLAHCKDCRKPIWRPEYARRAQGEKCGGRIGHPRAPAVPKGPGRRPGEGDENQLELFVVVKVKA